MATRHGRSVPSLRVDFASCPVEAGLGVLGRKWSLLVLRTIALGGPRRFSEIARATPGLTHRVLAMRLRELRDHGFLRASGADLRHVRWQLTEKGEDVLPILLTLVRFGSKWHADTVFRDGRARSLPEIFDRDYVLRVLGDLVAPAEAPLRTRPPRDGALAVLPRKVEWTAASTG